MSSTAQDVLADSATASFTIVGTPAYAELLHNTLRLIGASLVRQLHADDRPGLFSPVAVTVDGKEQIGGIIALETRAVIGWTTGMFRIKNHEAPLHYADITTVTRRELPATRSVPSREVLSIAADRSWTLTFAAVFDGGTSIVPFIEGVLDGSVKPVFDEAPAHDESGR
ncbi:MAG: hypothetical protein JHC95_09850 [Solirubrobacteraceae bacterium]|nr:hypothetical protein [Solirubrobacteraceae bacterium]